MEDVVRDEFGDALHTVMYRVMGAPYNHKNLAIELGDQFTEAHAYDVLLAAVASEPATYPLDFVIVSPAPDGTGEIRVISYYPEDELLARDWDRSTKATLDGCFSPRGLDRYEAYGMSELRELASGDITISPFALPSGAMR